MWLLRSVVGLKFYDKNNYVDFNNIIYTHRVLRELKDHLVSLAPQDPPAQLDPLADLDQLALMESLVTMETLDKTDLMEHL